MFLNHLFLGQPSIVLFAFLLEVDGLAGEIVIVGLDGSSTGRDLRKPFTTGHCPARFVRPFIDLFLGRGSLVAHIDRTGGALEYKQLSCDLRQFGNGLYRRGAGADNADAFPGKVHVVVPPRCMKGITRKRFHALDSGKLRVGENAVC